MARLPTEAVLGLAGLVAAKDAEVVGRLWGAGASLRGKTRMDEAALGASGDHPHYGRTGNPRAPDRSPGGFSGGSAAAVAAGHCNAALGTDTLESIRIPAAYCGVVGFKPGRGVLSTHGIVPLSSTLDTVGILAATVDGVASVLRLLGSPMEDAPRTLRLGVPDALDGMALAHPVRVAMDATRRGLAAAGWTVSPCGVPSCRWRKPRGQRSMPRCSTAMALPFPPPCARCCAMGGTADRIGSRGRAKVLEAAARGLDAALLACDLLMLPTTAIPAFAWIDGPPLGQADLTALANAGGHPAISIPAAGVPQAGLQLIGPHGSERRLLAAARVLAALPCPQ